MEFIFYLIGIVVTYFIIKFAVKHAIHESLEDIRFTIKKAIVEGLSEHEQDNEYKKQN